MPDFTIFNHGSILQIEPHTDAARDWIEEYIGQDNGYQPDYPTILLEPRYAQAIIEEMLEAGLEP